MVLDFPEALSPRKKITGKEESFVPRGTRGEEAIFASASRIPVSTSPVSPLSAASPAAEAEPPSEEDLAADRFRCQRTIAHKINSSTRNTAIRNTQMLAPSSCSQEAPN